MREVSSYARRWYQNGAREGFIPSPRTTIRAPGRVKRGMEPATRIELFGEQAKALLDFMNIAMSGYAVRSGVVLGIS